MRKIGCLQNKPDSALKFAVARRYRQNGDALTRPD